MRFFWGGGRAKLHYSQITAIDGCFDNWILNPIFSANHSISIWHSTMRNEFFHSINSILILLFGCVLSHRESWVLFPFSWALTCDPVIHALILRHLSFDAYVWLFFAWLYRKIALYIIFNWKHFLSIRYYASSAQLYLNSTRYYFFIARRYDTSPKVLFFQSISFRIEKWI